MSLNPQAAELNTTIQNISPNVHGMLSDKGKNIFFPKKGILGHTADAKGKKINATIGSALEDDGTPMRLQSIAKNITLDPGQVFPYAPGFGKPELRARWRELIRAKNPSLSGPVSLPVVTGALTNGLSITGYLFLEEGDVEIEQVEILWQ